jgi:hypothetical protein
MGAKSMSGKKRIGRPPKSEEDRRDVNFTFRSRGQMRERLKTAADAARRSISEEIEYRLENSFREDDRYGGPYLSAVFRLLADYKALAEAKAGAPWKEGDRVRNEIAQVFTELLAHELPGFHSVTIETVGQHGEIGGVTGYASDEARERDHPGLAEILRAARREAAAPRGEQPATDKREDPK